MTTPPATTGVQSKATVFMWRRLLRWSGHRLLHFATSGFVLTALLVALGNRSGDAGKQGAALLEKFIEHSVPNQTIYTVALGLLGVTLIAREVVAKIIRKWFAEPMIELAAHTFGVAFGVVAALIVSASYVKDLRLQVGALCAALGTMLIVFGILQLALWVAKGRLDSLLTSHSFIELAAALSGFAIAAAAFSDINTELTKAGSDRAAREIKEGGRSGSASQRPLSKASEPQVKASETK